jgi:hypothetical protein
LARVRRNGYIRYAPVVTRIDDFIITLLSLSAIPK